MKILSQKKGAKLSWIMYALLAAIFIGGVIYMIAYIQQAADYSRPIGKAAADLVLMTQEAEKALLYVDLSAKLSLLQTIHDMGANGGYYEEPDCQSFGGFITWKTASKNCVPNSIIADENFKPFMNDNLDEHLSQYPELVLPLNNYEFVRNQKDGLMKITGIALGNIEIDQTMTTPFECKVKPGAISMVKKIYDTRIDVIRAEIEKLEKDKKYDNSFIPSDSLIVGVIAQESGNDELAESGTGAVGLMQFTPATAYDYGLCDIMIDEAGKKSYCVNKDNRKNPEEIIRAGIEYLYKLIKKYSEKEHFKNPSKKGYTDAEFFALAEYNGGDVFGNARTRMGYPDDPPWAAVANALHYSDITYFKDEADKKAKVKEIRGYAPSVCGYKLAHEEFLKDEEGMLAEGEEEGPTGAAVKGASQYSQEGFQGFSAQYSVKPSFTTNINYNFEIYKDFFNDISLVEETCGSELSVDCVYDKVIKPLETGAKTKHKWIIRYNDSFLTRDDNEISPIPQEVLWTTECHSGSELYINDFLTFYQNCHYSESTDCYCEFPELLKAHVYPTITIVESEGAKPIPGHKTYDVYLFTDSELYKRQLTVPEASNMPLRLRFGRSFAKQKKRYALFNLALPSGAEATHDWGPIVNDISEQFFLYKDIQGLTVAKKDGDAFRLVRTTQNFRAGRDVLDFKNLKKCEPASVLRACVIDTSQKYLVYDDILEETVFSYPTVKFSYFVQDNKPPPPVTGIEAVDALHKEDSVIISWNKSAATDTEQYRIYYAEQGLVDYFSKQADQEEPEKNRATRAMIELRADQAVKKENIMLKQTRMSLVKGTINLESCKFDYTERGCLYNVEQDGEEKLIALEQGTIYNFYKKGEHDYYVYVLSGTDDEKTYDIAVTAIDASNNEIDNSGEDSRMLVVDAFAYDELAPDIVNFKKAETLEGGIIHIEWDAVTENLDSTESEDVSGYYIYSSCGMPEVIEYSMLEDSGNADPKLFTDTEFERILTTYEEKGCTSLAGFYYQPFDIHYVIIARDDNNNPEIDFDSWRNYGLKIIKLQIESTDMLSSAVTKVIPRIIEPDPVVLIKPGAPVPVPGERAEEEIVEAE